jgi:hypothetical protein
MEKKVAGFIVAPIWRAFMDQILPRLPAENFEEPLVEDKSQLKPVLRGIWQGGMMDASSTPLVVTGGVHSILQWVNKDNPRGPYPENPGNDSQYERWEYPVRIWAQEQNLHTDNPFTLPN